MMQVRVPDGRIISVPTEDIETAKKVAIRFAQENPRIQRGAQLGEEDVNVFGDVARGVGAGVVQAAAGVASLPAELIDLATLDEGEESAAEAVTDFFDKFTPDTHTGAGEAVKFMTQFIVPGGIAGKIAGKAGQGLSKARKLGVQTGAFAGADFAVATPDVETIGDFFESGPTKRTELENLEGIDLAQARIGNRFKVATEGALMSLGITGAFATPRLIKAGIDKTAESDLLKNAAQKVTDSNKPFAKVGLEPEEAEGVFGKAFQKGKKIFESNFTFKGDLPDRFVADLKASRIAQVAAQDQIARNGVEQITNGIKILTKTGLQNETDERVALNALQDFIFAERQGDMSREVIRSNAEKILKELDEKIVSQVNKEPEFKKIYKRIKGEGSLVEGATKIRNQIDNLSNRIIDSDDFIDDELKEVIKQNRGFYGTRIYRSFNDVDFDPFKGLTGEVDQARKEAYENAIEELKKTQPKRKPINNDEADEILAQLSSKKEFHNANNTPSNITEAVTLDGVAQGILKGRSLDNLPAVRDFLGEYSGGSKVMSGPSGKVRDRTVAEQREGIERRAVETIDKMSKAVYKKEFFDNVVRHNNTLDPNNKFLFDKRPVKESPENFIQIENNPKKFGALAGKYVKKENYAGFVNVPSVLDNLNNNSLYATFLGLKGMSQIAKTVYSPITQIRNATTASFFALANGNIGNGRDLVNSAKIILSEINQRSMGKDPIITKGSEQRLAKKSEIDSYYQELIDLGVVNSNAKIGEFEDLLKDAVTGQGGNFLSKNIPFTKTNLLQAARNTQNRFAGKLYQGSDDVWKTYSWEMELGKLKNVFKKDPNATISLRDAKSRIELSEQGINPDAVKVSNLDNLQLSTGKYVRNSKGDSIPEMVNAKDLILKREAAQIVKDTVPNYSRVPEFITKLRRMPFGNFIAFPAEILRTNANILQQSVREIASESSEIRSIGMKRLMGSMAVNGGIGATLTTAGQLLTGTDRDQINAWKRSVAADWDKNSVLIPVSSDKDGKIKEMYNFSYTNPYDYALRPARALYNAVSSGITEEKQLMSILGDATYDSIIEFGSPFMDESIITEKIIDLSRNQTRFGRQIWLEADTLGDRTMKGLFHVLDGLNPGVMPVKVQSGELAFKDFPKAVGSMVGVDPEKTVSRSGGQIDAAGEFVASLTGLKSVKPYLKDTLMYRTYEAADQVRESARIFNRVAKSRGRVSADDITNAYIKSNEQRFKKLRDLHTAIDDARTLGMSESDIYQVLKRAKAPNVDYLMAGKFKPFFPSNETMMFALESNENKLSNPFNMSDITRSYSSQAGRDFKPRAVEQAIEERRQKQIELRQKLAEQAQQQTSSINMPQPTQPFNRPSAGTAALRQVELNKLLGLDD